MKKSDKNPSRKERRNAHAEKVCRELRYQIGLHGTIVDWTSISKHFDAWMRNAKNNKYDRPK